MLQRLHLRDFVIVDDADIEFGAGFSALSGETGAGKSILLDALGLVMGARADASMVREGADRADINATFATSEAFEAWLVERDLAGDPGQLMLRRVVDADGRSRAFVNGHPATNAQLRELGERLVDIHGQHAAQSMLRAEGQRELLDAFAGIGDEVRILGRLHAAWRAAAAELWTAESNERELALERERLEWQAGELLRLRLVAGEWDELNVEQKRLSNAAALIEGSRGIAQALAEDDDAMSSRLYQLAQKLKPLAALDPALETCVEMLGVAQIQIDEAAATLSAYADRVDLDPERLDALDGRISALLGAARRLRLTPEALPAELGRLQASLERLTMASDVEALRIRMEACRAAYDTAAMVVSDKRHAAAEHLVQGVDENIQQLGMAGGRLQIAIERGEPGTAGIDKVEFRIAGHAGATPRPLAKVASGGELSRVGLAIAVLAATANPVPTLIFDEADAGVGGAVAEIIGTMMRRLGESRQVLCVTHLPQVAAKAHRHFAVSKARHAGRTVSRIAPLERAARVEEIARMLGGMEITMTTRKHARELLAADAQR
jgi:DNA repair protein RecN (Recombination protein N)